MSTQVSTAARSAMVNAVAALLNGGSVQIRTGSQPASTATAATGTLLSTHALSATAFGSASSGSAAAATIADAVAAATGNAGWFRALNSSGTAVVDGAVGLSGSGAEMIASKIDLTSGGNVKINSWSLTV